MSEPVLTRRSLLGAGAAVAALGGLPGCTGTVPGSDRAAPAGNGYPRTVVHELGETRIERPPQRIVCATDGGELCSLLALGGRPVGFGQRNDPLRPWVRDLAAGLDRYDLSGGETNFERLAAWAPDLVLVQNGFATSENLATFTKLAPTVATSFIDWRNNLRQVAQAVGLEDRGRNLERETDASVAAAAARLPGTAAGLRLRAVSAFSDGTVYLLNDASPLGKVAAAMGLAPLPRARTAGEAVDQISLEQLTLADGDLLLLLNFGADDGSAELRRRSVFRGLKAARAGRVMEVAEDDSHALYFDSLLTVPRNARYVERVVRSLR